jgi:hypothetical protein
MTVTKGYELGATIDIMIESLKTMKETLRNANQLQLPKESVLNIEGQAFALLHMAGEMLRKGIITPQVWQVFEDIYCG